MKKIDFKEHGPIISDKQTGELIYSQIKAILNKGESIDIDLGNIKSMATFCAKQIFGRLYSELGSNAFFERITISNASDDLKSIIRIGIQNALEEN